MTDRRVPDPADLETLCRLSRLALEMLERVEMMPTLTRELRAVLAMFDGDLSSVQPVVESLTKEEMVLWVNGLGKIELSLK